VAAGGASVFVALVDDGDRDDRDVDPAIERGCFSLPESRVADGLVVVDNERTTLGPCQREEAREDASASVAKVRHASRRIDAGPSQRTRERELREKDSRMDLERGNIRSNRAAEARSARGLD